MCIHAVVSTEPKLYLCFERILGASLAQEFIVILQRVELFENNFPELEWSII
jgi:hypothetical protein